MRRERERVLRVEVQRVVIVTFVAVVIACLPCRITQRGRDNQRSGPVLRRARRVEIHVEQARVAQARLGVVGAEQVIVNTELRRDTVSLLVTPSLACDGHRVTKATDVTQLIGRGTSHRGAGAGSTTREHGVILIGVVALCVLTIDAHVRAHLLCATEDVVVIVAVVVGIGQREGDTERDTVTHEVVESQLR